ncbi:hypothetical protein H4R27_003559 [Coemansia aciculifera]|nr:hypothetical protein H4R27_003559 [Coemansia aciculifera]
MDSVSPFQFLPTHVVQVIAKHVVADNRVFTDGTRLNYHDYRALLRPLLWTCSNFREVAYPLYCYHLIVTLTTTAFRARVTQYARTGCLSLTCSSRYYLGFPTHHLVKELDIELAEKSLYSGTALKMLSYMPYKYCAFPLARKFTIRIVRDELDSDREIKESEIEANISAFVRWVKRAMPRINEIRVQPERSDSPFDINARNFGDLVSQLLRLVNRVKHDFHNKAGVPVRFQLDGLRDLVHINCHSLEDSAQFILLARQNAQTLQYFDSHFSHPSNLDGLIRIVDESYVAYPCLHTLRLFMTHYESWTLRPVFEGAVPFPYLRRILLLCTYPFGDDVLFRGNAATLECLELPYDNISATMLIKRKVFTPTSHPKLLYVNAHHAAPVVPDTFATYTEELRFILGVGPGAPVRNIENPKSVAELTLALSSFGSCASIQFLLLPRIHFELLEVIALIKLLPQLSDLTIAPYIRVPEIADVTQSELPAYMISTYSPTGKRFKCLHWNYVVYGGDDGIDVLVECVLLLALVCPNFIHIMQFHIDCKKLEREIETTIASDRFKEHASRLRHLRVSRCCLLALVSSTWVGIDNLSVLKYYDIQDTKCVTVDPAFAGNFNKVYVSGYATMFFANNDCTNQVSLNYQLNPWTGVPRPIRSVKVIM